MDDEPRPVSISPRLIMAVIIVIVSLISYYSHSVKNPVTGENQHINLSVDQEVALGLQAAPQMEAQYGGPDPDPADQRRVQAMGNDLIAHSAAGSQSYPFKFHTLNDEKTINAFALPGGQVFITSGLLHRLKTPGQLAGVLGHEIGHVIARHGAVHLAKSRLTEGLSGAAVIATSDPNNPSSRNNAALAMAVRQLVDLKFGRGDELQADKLGLQFASEAGYDPRSMLDVMEILKEASKGGTPPEILSTHPDPGHREDRIKEEIKRLFPNGVPEGLKK